MTKHLGRAGIFGLLLFAIWGCDLNKDEFDDSEDLDEAVISCEVAIAHLEQCCPDFKGESFGQCTDRNYHTVSSGCDTRSTHTGRTLPEMTLEESICVRHSSCDSLVKRGVCDVVKKNGPRGVWSSTYDFNVDNIHESSKGTYEHVTVCLPGGAS